MSHFNTYRVQVNSGNDLLLQQGTNILPLRFLHFPLTDLAPVFPDPSYSQLSARSVMDSERTCAA